MTLRWRTSFNGAAVVFSLMALPAVAATVSRRVELRDSRDAAVVKTLIHEAAHILLHEPPLAGSELPRHVKEVEAESVAYVVASVHGMPADNYSFPYVARWAGEGGVRAVQATAGAWLRMPRSSTCGARAIEPGCAPGSAAGPAGGASCRPLAASTRGRRPTR